MARWLITLIATVAIMELSSVLQTFRDHTKSKRKFWIEAVLLSLIALGYVSLSYIANETWRRQLSQLVFTAFVVLVFWHLSQVRFSERDKKNLGTIFRRH